VTSFSVMDSRFKPLGRVDARDDIEALNLAKARWGGNPIVNLLDQPNGRYVLERRNKEADRGGPSVRS
jgi:hypothetical protein